MAPEIALKSLEKQGIIVELSGANRISAHPTTGDITAAHIAILREHKPAIVAFLRKQREAAEGRKNEQTAVKTNQDDSLRNHTRAEFERLVLNRVAHGPDTLAAICAGTDETELAAALVLCYMERRGLIGIVYRDTDTDTPPYNEESIIQAH